MEGGPVHRVVRFFIEFGGSDPINQFLASSKVINHRIVVVIVAHNFVFIFIEFNVSCFVELMFQVEILQAP